MQSVFGLRFQDALLEQFKLARKPTYGLVRSSGALAAPYPFVLYSDLYDHRSFIRALANSGFSGLLRCPEVRDAKSEEDLMRRLQTAVSPPPAMINGLVHSQPSMETSRPSEEQSRRIRSRMRGLGGKAPSDYWNAHAARAIPARDVHKGIDYLA